MVDNKDDIRGAFRVFDVDGNGFIDAKKLRFLLMSCGDRPSQEEADKMVKLVDADGDGRLNYNELVEIICRK